MEILIGIATTILGTILGVIATRWDSWRQTSSRGDLRGEWLSISHAADHEAVRDKVIISKKWGKLYLKNVGNEYGYSYEAYCTIEFANVVTGTWRSLREGSGNKGRILMIVNPQATSIIGVYSGKSVDGRDFILGWALAREPEELGRALKRLEKSFDYPRLSKVRVELGAAPDPAA